MLKATFLGEDHEVTEVLCDRIELADGILRLYQGRGRSEAVIERIPQAEMRDLSIRHSGYPRKWLGVRLRLALPGDNERQLPVAEELNVWAGSISAKGGAAGETTPATLLNDISGFDAVPSLWGDPSWNVTLPGVED